MRILIVDDDPGILDFARLLLEDSGFEVMIAIDGKAALHAIPQFHPALVLCDVFMPEMDGLELMLALKRDLPDIKVIAMSGGNLQGTFDSLPDARDLGAAGILYKPFQRAELLAVVTRVLGNSVLKSSMPGKRTPRDFNG